MRVTTDHPPAGAIHESSPRSFRVIELAAFLLIAALAALLRLGWPGVNSFAFDEARLSLIALDMARAGEFARLGMPSSVGVPNLPAAAWIFSLPYLVSADPLVATQFTGVLSLLAFTGTAWLARRLWGSWVGIAAALFMAASPYAVLYSRSIWAQNLLPGLGLLWGWTAYLGAAQQKRWAIGAHIFLTGFIFQVHFAGAALVLATFYFFARFRWWRNLFPVLVGGGLALLALLPFALEVACCRPDILDQYRAALGGESRVDLHAFAQLVQLALGLDWGFLLLGDLQPPDSRFVAVFMAALLAAGLVSLIVRARRDREKRVMVEILLAWLIASPLFFARHSTPVLIHYHLAALPALALLVGLGVDACRQALPRWLPERLKTLSNLPIVGLALVAVFWTVQLVQGFDAAGKVETPNGLGTPLMYTRAAAYAVPADRPVLFFTHGDDPSVDGEAAVFAALWWGRDYRIIQGESLLVLPDEPAYLMASLRALQAWEEIDAAGLAVDVQRSERREGANPFVTTLYAPSALLDGFTLLDESVRLQDGTQLEGWKVRRVGPRLRISTLWRVVESPPAGIYQQFHHLRDAATLNTGQPLHISDVPISAPRWQVGDRLVVMGDFFVDETGPFSVDVGHYTLPDLQRVAGPDGREGVIRLGPFEIPPRDE